jgi:hypothetical protein
LGKFVSSLFAFSRREERFDWLIWQGWNSSSSDSLLSFFFSLQTSALELTLISGLTQSHIA